MLRKKNFFNQRSLSDGKKCTLFIVGNSYDAIENLNEKRRRENSSDVMSVIYCRSNVTCERKTLISGDSHARL